MGVILGPILTPPGGARGAHFRRRRRARRAGGENSRPRPPGFSGPPGGPFLGSPPNVIRTPPGHRIFVLFRGGPPGGAKNGQKWGPGKCPILSRLGELLNTLRNVHIFRRRPGGPPGGPPQDPPSGGGPWGVLQGGLREGRQDGSNHPPRYPPIGTPTLTLSVYPHDTLHVAMTRCMLR